MGVMYLTDMDIRSIRMASAIIQQSPKSHFTIPQLAEKVMLPEKKLKAAFKQVYGVGLYTYLRELRLEKAKQLLQEGRSIKIIIKSLGYKSESNFCNAFNKLYGETPGSWRKKNIMNPG